MESNWDGTPQDSENMSVNDFEIRSQGKFLILFLNLTVS